MGDSKYIYAVASIRSKEKGLLTDADVHNLITMENAHAVLSFLLEKGWGQESDDKSATGVLSYEEEKTNMILKNLGVDERIVNVLSLPADFHNLKTAIKEVCTGYEDTKAFYEDKKMPAETLLSLVRDNAWSKLPEYMRAIAEKAKTVMLETRDGQRCDILVDRECLVAMKKAAKALHDSFITEYVERKVAVADIKIAVRACLTNRSLATISESLAPCDSFDITSLAHAAATNIDSVYDFLEKKGYAGAVDALKVSFSDFERWCDDRIVDMILPQKHKIDSSGPIVAYYLGRMNEIQMARIIITAKENDFPEEAIEKRLRRMYG